MTKNYAKLSGKSNASTLTPQTKKATKGQKKNNAGGYSFKVDDWTRLNRFLILGSESPTYYQSAQKLTKQNVNAVEKLIKSGYGKKVVDTAVEISDQGRAYKNGPALFVLAIAASYNGSKNDYDYATGLRKYSFDNLDKVARTGTHLFEFVAYCDSMRGWGKAFQKAVSNWYNDKPAEKVTYQVCKYASRRLEGELPWSHRDLLRKTHLKPSSEEHGVIYKYVAKGRESFSDKEWMAVKSNEKLAYIWAHEEAKDASDVRDIKKLIKDYNLAQESIPTEWRKDISVGKQLLQNMPITATIRGLGKMTANGVLKPLSKESSLVCDRITNEDIIKKGRIHPLQFLTALKVYKGPDRRHYSTCWSINRSLNKSSLTWEPIDAVCDALEDGFYKSFNYIEPTGKNYLLGIDVSGSMSAPCSGVSNLSCAEGAAALAMTIARTEKNYQIRGFAGNFVDLKITAKDSLDSALRKTRNNNFGNTDCSLPMQYALKNKLDVDVFVVITDSETYSGNGHPHEWIKKYRDQMNRPEAKLVVIAMTASKFSIADPNDPGMIDVVGFDANVPAIISEFVKGNI